MNSNSNLMLYYALFDGAHSAESALKIIFDSKTGTIKVEDVVVITQDDKGKNQILQTKELNKSMGILAGGAVGLLGGLLLSIPILGLGVGAAIGLRRAKKAPDLGIDNQFLTSVSNALYKNSSAILLLLDQKEITTVEKKLKQLNPQVYKQELSQETVDKMNQLMKE